jgi:hypothetical protein
MFDETLGGMKNRKEVGKNANAVETISKAE